jgi:tetratricopeptide (TPR) repeat protein
VKERALELFEQSAAAYRAGDLERAQRLLEEAYALDPDPTLLYNLARVYEGLGKLEAAVAAYRDYIARVTEAEDLGAIEKRIATLEQQITELRGAAERERVPPPAPPPSVETSAPTTRRPPSPAPWIVAGVGAVGLGAGAALGVLARAAHRDAVAEGSFTRARELQDRATLRATAANVSLIAGGALVVAGVGWGLFRAGKAPRAGTARPRGVTLSPGPGALWVWGHF